MLICISECSSGCGFNLAVELCFWACLNCLNLIAFPCSLVKIIRGVLTQFPFWLFQRFSSFVFEYAFVWFLCTFRLVGIAGKHVYIWQISGENLFVIAPLIAVISFRHLNGISFHTGNLIHEDAYAVRAVVNFSFDHKQRAHLNV